MGHTVIRHRLQLWHMARARLLRQYLVFSAGKTEALVRIYRVRAKHFSYNGPWNSRYEIRAGSFLEVADYLESHPELVQGWREVVVTAPSEEVVRWAYANTSTDKHDYSFSFNGRHYLLREGEDLLQDFVSGRRLRGQDRPITAPCREGSCTGTKPCPVHDNLKGMYLGNPRMSTVMDDVGSSGLKVPARPAPTSIAPPGEPTLL